MKTRCAVVLACTAATIAGCSIGRPILEPTTYIVDIHYESPLRLERSKAPDEGATASPRFQESMRIGSVRIAAPFGKEALVYRLDDVRYAADPYHAFAADPRELFGSSIAEWLDRSGAFPSVAAPGSGRPARYVLEVDVAELYGDFRPDRAPSAVLAIEFALIDQRDARPKISYLRSIERRIELPAASADELVRGYGTALSNVMLQITADLDRIVSGAAPP